MSIRYLCKGNSSPHGKPRVYFCAHPDDHEAYLRSIADELFAVRDCVLFYYPPDDRTPPSERTFELATMNLFVMPVTARLLTPPNRGLDDYALAGSKHIPVLPLMQESGLDAAFNAICGSIQYLDRNSTDTTALSYTHKLTKYLSAILTDDREAEAIRAAFDAYIFLSYRKKDRAEAQALMKLIHQNELCRDIAIWYDEFLTPGENFNDAIRAAMEKSALLALVVTPNLINEPNYVMSTEYPLAKQLGRPVMPVQMQPTDLERLRAAYAAIDDCTDAADKAHFTETLHRYIEAIALQPNDRSPGHNFCIGLAYLAGIDVERDPDRALGLITAAAEAGLIAAITKLVSMYLRGDGVRRDPKLALAWQNRLVTLRQEAYNASPDVERYIAYMDAQIARIDEVGSCVNDSATRQEHMQLCRRLIASVSTMTPYGDPQADRYGFMLYHLLGTLYFRDGRDREGIAALNDAIEAFYAYADRHGQAMTVETALSLFTIHIQLGEALRRIKEYASAKTCCEQAVSFAEAMLADAADTDMQDAARECLSLAYLKFGDYYQERMDYAQAKACYEKAQAGSTATSTDDLAMYCFDLAQTEMHRGEFSQAKAHFDEALKIWQKAAKEDPSPENLHALYACYVNLGDLHFRMARADYQKPLHPAFADRHKQARFDRTMTAAMEYYVAARQTAEPLYAATQADDDYLRIARCSIYMCQVLGWHGLLPAAKRNFKSAHLAIRTISMASGLSKADLAPHLTEAYSVMGEIHALAGKYRKVEKWYKKVIKTWQNAGVTPPSRELAIATEELGRAYDGRYAFKHACDCFTRCSTDFLALLAVDDSANAFRDVYACYCTLRDAKTVGYADSLLHATEYEVLADIMLSRRRELAAEESPKATLAACIAQRLNDPALSAKDRRIYLQMQQQLR